MSQELSFLKKPVVAIFVIVIIVIISGIFAISCIHENTAIRKPENTSEEYGDSFDHFPVKIKNEYAEGFRVEYHDNYKIVNIPDPWGRESEDYTYILVQRGTKPPEDYKDSKVFYIPVENVVTMSTTQIPPIIDLGGLETIKGVAAIKSINSQPVIERYNEGLISEISTQDANVNTNLDIEKLIEMEPDAVFVTAVQDPAYDNNRVFEEVGLKSALVNEYMEKTPLARAEWIKYFSLFYNREAEANEIFDNIESLYTEISGKAKEATYKPTVLSGNDWQGTWYVPGGESFMATLLEDAGADYIWSDDQSTGSVPLDFEVVYAKAADADFWINPGTAFTLEDLVAEDERYCKFLAFRTANVYNSNARMNKYGGNDYWESGVSRPDIILMDLIKIFHPEIVPEHELYYFRQLNQ